MQESGYNGARARLPSPGPMDLPITLNVLRPVASNNHHGTFHIVNATALDWFIETTLVGRSFNPKRFIVAGDMKRK